MQLFYEPQAVPSGFVLNLEEARHCIKVLRKRIGETIHVVDGQGTFYECHILNDNIKNCELSVFSSNKENLKDGYRHIAIAPTKNLDRIEWFVEKAVEIGIDEISFILCDNSERRILKLDRIIKKAIGAMKQSLKATLPVINELISFRSLVTEAKNTSKYIAYVDFENNDLLKDILDTNRPNLLLIGPEGDFSNGEIALAKNNDFKQVSLGNSRLRTETAGIVACTFLNT